MTSPFELEVQSEPEKPKEIVEDNARKFLVGPLDSAFLEKSKSVFLLTTNWLVMGEDTETKLAHKAYPDGTVKILLISKTTKDGHRNSEKQEIDEDEYTKLLEKSVGRLAKTRYEFDYEQNGTVFDVKYDVFSDSNLHVLEVDAPSEEERDSFKPSDFPSELSEVTGDMQYYGYRVTGIV